MKPECEKFSANPLEKYTCQDPTAAKLSQRINTNLKTVDSLLPEGTNKALQANQKRWEKYANFWLKTSTKADSVLCSSPRAFLFDRAKTLEKAASFVRAEKRKQFEICYDNTACVDPSSSESNAELICETLFLGLDEVPTDVSPKVLKLLGDWSAEGHPFETRINNSTSNKKSCETYSKTSLVEYLRGGYATISHRFGDTCNSQSVNNQIHTYHLRTKRTFVIHDFVIDPQKLLERLQDLGESEILQTLLRKQLSGTENLPTIEPPECAKLSYANLNDVSVYVTKDGLRINRLFEKPPRDLIECQTKVEQILPTKLLKQLLKSNKKSPATQLLKNLR